MINILTRRLRQLTQVLVLTIVCTIATITTKVYAETPQNQIVGSGASFPAPVYSKWATNFAEQFKILVNYQSIGSGGGVKQIKASLVDFGASDYPLSQEELDQNNLFQFPALGGAIVLAVNLRELNDKIVLDGPVVADIYMGKITKWNDPRIQELNPGLQLPDLYIAVLFRSDGSGTTYNFSKYLAEVSPEFNQKYGVGKTINFPIGLGGKGNEGVAAVLPRVYGAIGYMEYGYAKTMHMGVAAMKNQYGAIVRPTEQAFEAAIQAADWSSLTPNVSNTPSEEAWPINAITFILIHRDSPKKELLKDFFSFGMLQQQAETTSLMYTPFSTEVATKILSNPQTFALPE
ncbi:phosphate ABC transporter substrate-binding protein PstS [Psittacicella gerlachiana]|nr:phosphate ABC transporter substrate-binding protein PstS [Psittacicella gerlachiana]